MPAISCRLILLTFLATALVGCTSPNSERPDAKPLEQIAATDFERRTFDPTHDGESIIAGISYGPYRVGQRPGGPDPTDEQLLEDLQIISERWRMLRVYGSRGPTERILRIIDENELPVVVMVGAWIGPEDEDANEAEVAAAIRLANDYPDTVLAVSVGNETQVSWSGYRYPTGGLIEHIRKVRGAVSQPVTTADDYNFWNKPESHAVADEVDFLLLHAYAMWNQQSLENAVPWTAEIISSIEQEHPDLTVVLGETGWATELNPEGDESKYIKAEAGPAQQAEFYRAFTEWAHEAGQHYFYFEAFDEPWKGSDDPREVEKHWGLWDVERQPKPAMRENPAASGAVRESPRR